MSVSDQTANLVEQGTHPAEAAVTAGGTACVGSLMKIWLFTLIWISNAIMIVVVVGAGTALPNYMYAFTLELPVFALVVFWVIFVIEQMVARYRGSPGAPSTLLGVVNIFQRRGEWHVCKFWISGVCGLCWALNYTFLLAANPFVKGALQVIINQLNIVMMFLMSRFFLVRNYSSTQSFIVLLIVVIGLVGLVAPSEGSGKAGWIITYAIGTVTIGMAMCWTDEGLAFYTKEKQSFSLAQYYFYVNLYALVFSMMLFPVPLLASQDNFYKYTIDGIACLFGGSCATGGCDPSRSPCNASIGVACIWGSSFFSFLGAYFSGALMHESRGNTAMLSQMGMMVGPFVSNMIFVCMPVGSLFHSEPTTLEWAINLGIVLLSLAYQATKVVPAVARRFDVEQKETLRFTVMDCRITPEVLKRY